MASILIDGSKPLWHSHLASDKSLAHLSLVIKKLKMSQLDVAEGLVQDPGLHPLAHLE